MRIEKEKCDQCGLEIDDYYSHPGWIKIKIEELTVSKGRGKDRTAKTNFVSNKELDLCSVKCFEDYLEKYIHI